MKKPNVQELKHAKQKGVWFDVIGYVGVRLEKVTEKEEQRSAEKDMLEPRVIIINKLVAWWFVWAELCETHKKNYYGTNSN